MVKMPDFSLEKKTNCKIVAGIDEAGCGPWAGPVVAACVKFHEFDEAKWSELNDSKKLSKKKREHFFAELTASSQLTYGVGIATVNEIDELNIANATRLAMERAIKVLSYQPEHLLIDGIRKPSTNIPITTVIKGDSISLSIAAASIIAKVNRDEIMKHLSQDYPLYQWSKNAGYGTAFHQEMLKIHGITPHHRKSFAPIRALLEVSAA